MSRFNAEAYDKIFPRSEDIPAPESAVETFRPTMDKLEGKDPDAPEVEVKEDTVKPADPIIPETPEPEGGVEDGYAEHSESDSE